MMVHLGSVLRSGLLAIIAAAIPLPALGQAKNPPVESATPAARPPANDLQRAGKTAGNIAEQPLRDLNIIRNEPSPALLKIMQAPYSLAGIRTCGHAKTEIDRLTAVLGPDVDSAEARAAKETSSEFVFGTVETVAASLIPGAGIIRRLSGAAAAEKRARAAIFAGSLRRAYLKGWAHQKNCRL